VTEHMNDQDRARERDHWQAIAEQLGLAPEPQETADQERTKAEPVEPPGGGKETARDLAPSASVSAGSMNLVDVSAAPGSMIREQTPELEPARSGAEEREDDKPRGRGRRKRGLKESKSRRQQDPAQLSSGASIAEKEPSTPSKRRERGRGRKKPSRTKRAEEEELTAVGTESTTSPEPAQAEDEDEGYGDWTVPSWSELIASLYRPER
jgi:hypothetical protein